MNTGDQPEGDRHDRRRDFLHGPEGGVARRQARLDPAIDVFHHDDRVVDHDADRQHQPEEREIVQRETKDLITAKVPISETGIAK